MLAVTSTPGHCNSSSDAAHIQSSTGANAIGGVKLPDGQNWVRNVSSDHSVNQMPCMTSQNHIPPCHEKKKYPLHRWIRQMNLARPIPIKNYAYANWPNFTWVSASHILRMRLMSDVHTSFSIIAYHSYTHTHTFKHFHTCIFLQRYVHSCKM